MEGEVMDMFRYSPGTASINATISVVCGDDVITVDAKVVGIKKEYDTDMVFGVINAYVSGMEKDHPGYKAKLAECYRNLNYIRQCSTNITQEELLKLVATNVNNVLSLFSYDLIRTFIYSAVLRIIPSKITLPYEEKRKESEWNSPEQTYGTDDYIDLMTLSILFKPVLPFFCAIMNKFGSMLNKATAESIFYPVYNQNIILLPPVVKLRSWIIKHSLKDTSKRGPTGRSKDDNIRSRVMAYDIDDEGMINYVISVLLFKELPKRYMLTDTPDSNGNHLISYAHGIVKNKLSPDKADVTLYTDKIGNKDMSIDGESDKESIYEGVRATEVISASIEIEANTYTSNVWYIYDRLENNIKDKINQELLSKIEVMSRQIEVGDITCYHIMIAKISCGSYMDPRLISYITMESLRNVLALGYCFLKGLGFEKLAFMLMSRTEPSIGDDGTFMLGSNKTTVNDEVLAKINYYYPLTVYGQNRKVKSGYNNYIMDYVDRVYDIIKMLRWIPFNGMEDEVAEYFGKPKYSIPVNMKTKEEIYRLLIASEELN